MNLKFTFSEKAKKIDKIFTVNLTVVKFIYSEKATKGTVKSKLKISQNFVAFSEYTNFTTYILSN